MQSILLGFGAQAVPFGPMCSACSEFEILVDKCCVDQKQNLLDLPIEHSEARKTFLLITLGLFGKSSLNLAITTFER
jgi:hypothetical protein